MTFGFKFGIFAVVTAVRGAALVRIWRGSRSGAGLSDRASVISPVISSVFSPEISAGLVGVNVEDAGVNHVAPDAPRMTPKMTLLMTKYWFFTAYLNCISKKWTNYCLFRGRNLAQRQNEYKA